MQTFCSRTGPRLRESHYPLNYGRGRESGNHRGWIGGMKPIETSELAGGLVHKLLLLVGSELCCGVARFCMGRNFPRLLCQ